MNRAFFGGSCRRHKPFLLLFNRPSFVLGMFIVLHDAKRKMSANPHLCRLCIHPPESGCSRINAAAAFALLCFPTLDDKSPNNKGNVRHWLNPDLQTRTPAVSRPSSRQLTAMKPEVMDQQQLSRWKRSSLCQDVSFFLFPHIYQHIFNT